MSDSTQDQDPRRILVLGSATHSRQVTAFTWNNIPANLNVADFDAVIMNLVPYQLDETLVDRVHANTVPTQEQVSRLLFSEDSQLIVIGSPGTQICRIPFSLVATWWLPVVLVYQEELGEQIRDVRPEFESYFRNVRGWTFYWTGRVLHNEAKDSYVSRISSVASNIWTEKIPLAQTRFQKAIGMLAILQLVNDRRETVRESGTFAWLPRATEISHQDAVDLLLRDRFGVASVKAMPDWVASYPLPRQLPIEEDIDRHAREIRNHQEQLIDARRRLDEETRFKRLLYESGETLETVVRDALGELGGRIEDFEESGKDDGRLASPVNGESAMLEIKGLTGSLRLSNVSELQRWVSAAEFDEDWSGKGILIANTYSSRPPDERDDPFPNNCVRHATRLGYCLLKTSQIFRALQDHQRGDLDIDAFWTTIFDTSGVCQLPDLTV